MIEALFFVIGFIAAMVVFAVLQRQPGDSLLQAIMRPFGGGGPPPDGKK